MSNSADEEADMVQRTGSCSPCRDQSGGSSFESDEDPEDEDSEDSKKKLRSWASKRKGIHEKEGEKDENRTLVAHSGSPHVTRRRRTYDRSLLEGSEKMLIKNRCGYVPESVSVHNRYQFTPESVSVHKSEHTESHVQGPLRQPLSIVVCLIVLIAVLYLFLHSAPSAQDEQKSTDELSGLFDEVSQIVQKFKNLPKEPTYQFSSGIRHVLESKPHQPSMFVLLHEANGMAATCLALEVGRLAARYLHSEEGQPLHLQPQVMRQDPNMSTDHGWILENYRPQIELHRSVVVSDLQELPGSMARAFHSLCDSEDPTVPKALYLFTLQVEVLEKKPVQCAEDTLHKLWEGDIDDDKRQALITRIIGDVVVLPKGLSIPKNCFD